MNAAAIERERVECFERFVRAVDAFRSNDRRACLRFKTGVQRRHGDEAAEQAQREVIAYAQYRPKPEDAARFRASPVEKAIRALRQSKGATP